MVTLTEKAVAEVKKKIAETEQLYLRVGVRGGGCSGFTYNLTLDDVFNEAKDTMIEQDGVKIVVDKRSSLYLSGSQIDYHDELMKQGFVFTNPQATGRCGCGSSFSV